MHRSLSAALMAAWWLVGLGPLPAKAEAGTSETLSQARALLDRGEARAAVPLLEDALPDVAATDRAPLLDLLREAYETAIPLAEAGGRNAEAEQYRENLEILSRKARPRTAPAAPLSKPEPSRAEPRRERPSLAPIDAAIRRAALPSEQSPLPTPEPASVPEPVKPPAPANAIANTAPTESRPPSPAAPPPMPAAPTAKANLAADVLKADTAFIGKKYAEAGQLYANLDREQRLPSSRRDHWAYCRWVEVVRRINAKPGTPEQWSRIDEEIEKIRALSPKNWFGEYLRNRAAERTAGPKGNKPGGLVVRGSSPDEPPRATAPAKRPDRPRGVGSAPAPAPEAAHEVNRAAAMPGNWQVRETPNFRVMHADADLAEKVATVAEAARESQLKRWIGPAPRASSTWSPKCDVYLYPTARVFSEMTGQTEQSPGFSTMGMSAGKIIARRINLRADYANLLAAVLPHEITHVLLADLFPSQQIPRWADEGMAVLSEPPGEQRLRAADLEGPLGAGRVFKMEDLMAIDYPDGRHWALYYAQSVSLTRFLVEQGTPARFIEFVQGCQLRSHEEELRRVYGIDGYADLQKRWLAYARTQTAAIAAASASPEEKTATRR